jgi:hypothetical protein
MTARQNHFLKWCEQNGVQIRILWAGEGKVMVVLANVKTKMGSQPTREADTFDAALDAMIDFVQKRKDLEVKVEAYCAKPFPDFSEE